MPYYGHRCGIVPRRIRDAWWVCSACMPEFVPRCGIGSAPAPVIDRERLAHDPVGHVRTEVPWLRVAFAHLGKLDTVAALELLDARTRGPAGSG